MPEVTDYEIYVGTASPYNFNGLVRHYFLRQGPNVADIQVNLVPKGDRKRQSHEIAKRVAARASTRSPALRRPRQGGRGAARPAGARDAGGRGLRPGLRPADRAGPRGPQDLRADARAWWTWTGTSRTTRRSTASRWTRRRRRCTASPPSRSRDAIADGRAGHGRRPPARRPARRRTCPSSCGWTGPSRSDVEDLLRLKVRGSQGLVPLGELVHVRAVRRGQEHLPQEPEAGGLRHRRRGRARGEPRLRHPEDERATSSGCGRRRATTSSSTARTSPSPPRSWR